MEDFEWNWRAATWLTNKLNAAAAAAAGGTSSGFLFSGWQNVIQSEFSLYK